MFQISGGCFRSDSGEFVAYKGDRGQPRAYLKDEDWLRYIEHIYSFLMSDDQELRLGHRVIRKTLTRIKRYPMVEVPILGAMTMRLIKTPGGGFARFILELPFETVDEHVVPEATTTEGEPHPAEMGYSGGD